MWPIDKQYIFNHTFVVLRSHVGNNYKPHENDGSLFLLKSNRKRLT